MDNTVNKYKKHYDLLCLKARNRSRPSGYIEWHHILPKSLGGVDSISNLVALTGREHFIAHLLLVKMLSGPPKYKMLRALVRMAKAGNTAARYELARKIISVHSRGRNNPAYGRKWWHHPDTHETIYITEKETPPDGFVSGLPFQRGGVKKGLVWINDGRKETFIEPTAPIPCGWIVGRSKQTHIEQLRNAAKKRHTVEKDKEHSLKMKGRISIYDGKDTYKKVALEKLDGYLSCGWVVKGRPTKNSKRLIINGREYSDVSSAVLALGMKKYDIDYRLRSTHENWKEWYFIDMPVKH